MYRSIRITAIALIIAVLCSVCAFAATPSDWSSEHPEDLLPGHLFCESAIVIDQKTGVELFSKNPDERMYPASTTKIMTLLLAIESGIPLDTVISIPAEAVNIPADSSVVPVYAGEEMPFIDLLYGFMLNSGNDGAIAIAITVSGTVDRFVALMNQRARELGCTSTNFANPHGYHDASHYTTARDLSLITKQAMSYDVFRQIVGTEEYTMKATNKRGELTIKTRVELVNSESKYYYKNCTGIKTGYHSQAGQCVVASAEWGNRTVIVVCLKSTVYYVERKWYDAARMMEFGRTCYEEYNIRQLYDLADERVKTLQVENAVSDDVYGGKLDLLLSQTTNDGYALMVLKNSDEAAESVQYFNDNAVIKLSTDYQNKIANYETIEAGSIVGQLEFTAEDGEVITGSLIAAREVKLEAPEFHLNEYLNDKYPALAFFKSDRFVIILAVIFVLIVIIIAAAIIHSARKARRRRKLYEQRKRAYLERQRRANAASGKGRM